MSYRKSPYFELPQSSTAVMRSPIDEHVAVDQVVVDQMPLFWAVPGQLAQTRVGLLERGDPGG